MTSKNLFFNLMLEDLKRRIWAIALSFLTFFFMLPMATLMIISNRTRTVEGVTDIETIAMYKNEIAKYVR